MIDLERLRYWVRKEITGTASQEINDEDIDDLLNFSLWNIESQFDFRTREAMDQLTLVPDQYLYDLGDIIRLDAITSVAIVTDHGARHKLSRTTRDWIDANTNFERDKGLPTRYLRENLQLTIHPVPVEELTLDIHFRQGVASLAEGDVETTGLPRNWDEIVIAGAVWRGLKAIGAPLDRIRSAMQTTGALITMTKSTEEKELKDSRYARVDVIWEHPEDHLEGHER